MNKQSNWGGQNLYGLEEFGDTNEYRGSGFASNPYGGPATQYAGWGEALTDSTRAPEASAKPLVVEDSKFSKPTDVSRMWGDESIATSMDQFKKCQFRIVQVRSGVPVVREVTLMFATPDNPVHSDVINGYFGLEINNPASKQNASFMFSGRNMNTPISSKMADHITNINASSNDEEIALAVPEKTEALMIKQLALGNVCSSVSQPRPFGLFIKGIDNQTVVHTHACSWNPAQSYKAIAFPGQRSTIVYQSGSTASPHLEAIHGVHKCEKGASLILNNWGPKLPNSKENCRSVDVRSGYFVFLAYHMTELIKQWIAEDKDKKLPPGINKERYDALVTMHEGWKATKIRADGRHIPIDIYHKGSDLTDGYAGHVITALSGSGQTAWTIAPEEPVYRVPDEFLAFAAKYYEQTISPITMTKHDGIEVTAEYSNKADVAVMKELSVATVPPLLMFNVVAWIFVPRLFAIIKEVKDQAYQLNQQ
jgi:hypothetical protein